MKKRFLYFICGLFFIASLILIFLNSRIAYYNWINFTKFMNYDTILREDIFAQQCLNEFIINILTILALLFSVILEFVYIFKNIEIFKKTMSAIKSKIQSRKEANKQKKKAKLQQQLNDLEKTE